MEQVKELLDGYGEVLDHVLLPIKPDDADYIVENMDFIVKEYGDVVPVSFLFIKLQNLTALHLMDANGKIYPHYSPYAEWTKLSFNLLVLCAREDMMWKMLRESDTTGPIGG